MEGDGLILFWDTSGIISQKFRALVLFKGGVLPPIALSMVMALSTSSPAWASTGIHVNAIGSAFNSSQAAPKEFADFFLYDSSYRSGVHVGAMRATPTSEFNTVLTGAGPGGSPHVRFWVLTNPDKPQEQLSFIAYDASFKVGVAVS